MVTYNELIFSMLNKSLILHEDIVSVHTRSCTLCTYTQKDGYNCWADTVPDAIQRPSGLR